MNRFFSKPISKITVDILLVAGFLLSAASSRHATNASWGSFHCIASMAWYALMFVHIWQHWRMTKALAKWNVMKRNIITTLTVLLFILMAVSIIFFVGGVNHKSLHIHHAIAHIFWIVVLIHTIHKTKRFKQLVKQHKSKDYKLNKNEKQIIRKIKGSSYGTCLGKYP
jgi:hypothetical protein